jgi:hypothetical protein
MSGWGHIVDVSLGEKHVVPCDRDGTVVGGHIASRACHCRPRPDAHDPSVILHNDPQRGGSRARAASSTSR